MNTIPNVNFSLGGFLRDRRSRLQPGPGVQGQRRTPGLRREEVAARAGVSVTWYTWLEQGRGGPPSDQVLEALVGALELDAAGREVLFLLAKQRPPPLKSAPFPPVRPALQRVLDAMPSNPVYVKTLAFDIVGWNTAAAAIADYAPLPTGERNVLRRLFGAPVVRATIPDWESEARFVLATFRLDAARAGSSPEVTALVDELRATSADFRRFWAENQSRHHGIHLRRVQHPRAGLITFEVSSFAVEGGDGLSMIVYTPVAPADAQAMASLLSSKPRAEPAGSP
jgi:transcriptional regulator with XRE-family HTH domain